jgi:phospholipase/carboxylesterase
MLELSRDLPPALSYASVRGPYLQNRKFSWFAAGKSLEATCRWFEDWLDQASLQRPVVLIGFSAGAAFAGGALLVNPVRYLGAALLCGTLPFDADVQITPHCLEGIDVFLAHKLDDSMIPRELLDRTWRYLADESGARCNSERYEGGHGVSRAMLSDLSVWLEQVTSSSPKQTQP